MYEDTTVTEEFPAVTETPQWFAELKPAPVPRRPRPCPHCLKRRHRIAATVLSVAALLALSVLGYAVHVKYGLLSGSQAAPVAAAGIAPAAVHRPVIPPVIPQEAIAPRVRPRAVMPTTAPTHQSVMTPRAVVAVTHRPVPQPTHSSYTPSPPPTTPATAPTHSTPPPAPTPTPTHTHTGPPPSGSLGAQLLAVAEREQGVPYVFGGDTPGGFDCSGLVYWAAQQLGITIPRDTYGMLAGSAHLTIVSSPEPGDLAFFGTGHVELYVSPGRFFGAQQTGTLVGFHNYGSYYVPTLYLRIT